MLKKRQNHLEIKHMLDKELIKTKIELIQGIWKGWKN